MTLSSCCNGVCRPLRHASHDVSGNNQLCCSLLCPFAQGKSIGPVSPWPNNRWYAGALPTLTWSLVQNHLGYFVRQWARLSLPRHWLREAPSSKRVASTNTFFCIGYHDIPLHKRKEICPTMVACEVCLEKDDPKRTQITIGGNRICYPGNVCTNTASLELLKLLFNSVLSQKGARFSSIDLKYFYLDTPMPKPKYICIKILDILDELIDKYKLTGLDRDG